MAARTGCGPLRVRFAAIPPTRVLQRGNNAAPIHFF
jgi:hypothetical protein